MELQVEVSGLMTQNQSLDRINRFLAEAIDEYSAEENVPESGGVQNHHSEGYGVLQARVDNLVRENNGLRKENERLTTCLNSYGRDVLAEHNYNK